MKWFKRRKPEVKWEPKIVKITFRIEFNDGQKMFLDYDHKIGEPQPQISAPIWDLSASDGKLYYFRWDKIRYVTVQGRKEGRK